jgi:LacI family transcriptional regulator
MNVVMKHISQQDIAHQLGIAVSTVSRALNGKQGVSEELRQQICDIAHANRYRPNPFARGLRLDSPHIIGVLIPNISTFFFSDILKNMESEAQKNGFFSVIVTSNEHVEEEQRAISNLLSLHVEGLMICLSQETRNYDHISQLVEDKIPLVLYDRVVEGASCSTVTIDDADSAREATLYMIERGARRVAFLGGANYLSIVAQRKHGYIEALRQSGLPIDPQMVACHEMEYNTGLVDTLALLNSPQPPDAILAMNDTLAFAALEAIKSRGLRVPNDVQLIGYTDERHARYVEPKLTAVRHNTAQMGRRACEMLIAQIRGENKPKHAVIPTHLEIRGSTK